MNKKCIILIILFVIFTFSLSAQYTVGDVWQHGGWYSIRFEMHPSGNATVYVTQCYPSGHELEIIGNEREELPLYLKVLCLGLLDEIKGSFDFEETTFEEDGIFGQLASFSMTFIFRFTKPDEFLTELGDQIVNKYSHLRWP